MSESNAVMAKATPLEKEQQHSSLMHGFFVATLLTGFITYFWPGATPWQQWTHLMHALVGVALAGLLVPYSIYHFNRTIGQRRPLVIFSGLLLTLSLLLLVITGLKIVLVGSTESGRWIYNLHILSGYASVGLLPAHILIHCLFYPERRKNRADHQLFNSFTRTRVSSLYLPLLLSVGVVFAGSVIYEVYPEQYSTAPAVADYSQGYGPHPFRPSQTETVHGSFVDLRQIDRSADCMECHTDIGNQWAVSTHKLAALDPAYVTNVSLLSDNKGIAATRYCEGCHAPIALLTGQLSEGGLHGGIKDTPANNEGVNCLACHGISNIVHLDGVASYEFKGLDPYLFESATSSLGKELRHFLIKINPDLHRANMNRDLLGTPEFCATCHTQFMDESMNNWGWVKMQDDYAAWLNGPFSGQNNQSFAHAEGKTCKDCHMPQIAANDPSASTNGMVSSHHFVGANTMLPFILDMPEQLEATREFLQNGKMRVTLDEPRRRDAVQSTVTLNEAIRDRTEAPFFYYLGETANIDVIVSNTGVGHDFPGGTIDINEAWLAITVVDAENNLVYEEGAVDASNTVDPDSHFYRGLAVDRNGQLVWRHDLFNRVGESYKHVIPAGESDVVTVAFDVPEWAKSPLTITATLKYRKLNDRYAQWALKEAYRPLPIVDVAKGTLVLPVKTKPLLE